MWVLVVVASLVGWKYRTSLLPGVFHGERRYYVSDYGTDVNGPTLRSRMVPDALSLDDAVRKMALVWYGPDVRDIWQIAGSSSGPFSIHTDRGERFLYAE